MSRVRTLYNERIILMISNRYPHLLAPGRINNLEIKNRIMVTAMGVSLSEEDGTVGERLIAYHEEQAKGGAGLIISGVAGVAWPVGAVAWQQTAISEDKFLPGLTRLCDRIHAHGSKIAVQLHHGGLVAGYSTRGGHPLWAPSIPPAPAGSFLDYFLPEEMAAFAGMTMPTIKVLEKDDIATVVRQFGEAAARAKKAGFDAIEIHGGHGYLLSSFISPKTNSRTDDYGGPIENRLRLLLEVIASVRASVGPDFPVWVKLDSAEIGKKGGITLEDAKIAARMVAAAGVDAITVSAYHETGQGKLHSDSNIPHIENAHLPAAAAIKAEVSIPVIALGRVEVGTADRVIGRGEADFIAMGRKLLADPHLPNKLLRGEEDKVRPCVYCYTCVSAIYAGSHTRCAVNSELAFEHQRTAATAAQKRVLVVGGGPGGMESARRLAELGHQVTLIEKSDRLGGTLRFAALAYDPNERLLNWLRRGVEEAGVDIRLGTEVTPALVASLNPDDIIVATGAVRGMPDLPGSDLPHVYSGDDMRKLMLGETSEDLRRKTSIVTRLATRIGALTGATANLDLVRKATHGWMPLGQNIVIIGGELVGIELAEFLHERGRMVTIVDETPRFGKGLTLVRRMRILAELQEHGVAMKPRAANIRVEAGAVCFDDAEGSAQRIPADHVIVAKGAEGDTSLGDALRAAGHRVYIIGDANGVGYIEGAMRGAYDACAAIAA